MAWNIPLVSKIHSQRQIQKVNGVLGHTVQFRTKRSVSRVKCRMSGAEQKPETGGSSLQGALLRIFGPTALSFMIALEGHIQFTGPLSKLDLVDALMAFTEITVLTGAGLFVGTVWAFQHLLLDSEVLNQAIQRTWGALVPDDSSLGKALDSKTRSFIKDLRSAPGVQGFIVRAILDLSGITSEPGIVRLVETVEQESRAGAARPTSMSALVIAAVNGAIAGRLDDAKVAAVLVCAAGVAGADGLLLLFDRLAAR
uniref:Uncharacterized protein n=1 Tax=Cryptomonas curvata TaxID=233186 RepID=A0A7S0N618_9CRYP